MLYYKTNEALIRASALVWLKRTSSLLLFCGMILLLSNIFGEHESVVSKAGPLNDSKLKTIFWYLLTHVRYFFQYLVNSIILFCFQCFHICYSLHDFLPFFPLSIHTKQSGVKWDVVRSQCQQNCFHMWKYLVVMSFLIPAL